MFSYFLLVMMVGEGGGSSTALIGPEGGEITSADGRLTLTFPPGALSEDTGITIRKIDPNDLPPEFEGLDGDLAYLLEPDGIEFAVPVTATLLLDEEPVQGDGSLQTEVVLLLTSSDGELEVLENLSKEVDGDANTTIISGQLSHFSPLVRNRFGITVSVFGVPDSLPVGGMFEAIVEVIKPDTLDNLRITADPESPPRIQELSNPPIVNLTVPRGDQVALPFIINNGGQFLQGHSTYRCDFVGRDEYAIFVFFTLTSFALSPFTGPIGIRVDNEVTCVGEGPTPTPSPTPVATPTPTPTPQPTPGSCVKKGVYQSSPPPGDECGIGMFTLNITVDGNLALTGFGTNPGEVLFNKTDKPDTFFSASNFLDIFGVGGHSCDLVCGPGQNQLKLICVRPGAMCMEVFTLQQ